MQKILYIIIPIILCKNYFSQQSRFIESNTNLYSTKQQYDAYYEGIGAFAELCLTALPPDPI